MPNARRLRLVALLCLPACSEAASDPSSGDDGSTSGLDGADPSIADESETGDVASTSETGAVESTGTTENQPPPTPMPMSPSNGAQDVLLSGELCWTPVEDPDGDPVRYRVWLDDMELSEGKLEELPGWEGPCVGPLDFTFERSYTWTVSAFEVDAPERESARAEPWTFTVVGDGFTRTVFEDDFDGDLDWTVGGDATSGAWTRGNPVPTSLGQNAAQPGECAGGASCYFTGQNPDGDPDEADVAGGSTTLTSPAFDLSGFAVATINVSRFFFKSERDETGSSLRIELLTPDPDAPDGTSVYVLGVFENEDEVEGANAWAPLEYAVCGLPMVEGTRVRVVATDLGDGITEAAIDSVAVVGHFDGTVCSSNEVGSLCDPEVAQSCGEQLLCCPRGTVNTGVYRCADPVPSMGYPGSYPEGEGFDGPLGCDAPDLAIADDVQPCLDTIYVSDSGGENYCAMIEGCVGGPGTRRILRFSTNTPNIGSRDLTMGVPANHPDLFHPSECHGHYHFDGYARYALLGDDGLPAAEGHKQAFCLMDTESWAWDISPEERTYRCANQGISVGWRDEYYPGLDCQWIDVTGVPDDAYTLRISVNPPAQDSAEPPLVERDYTNNILEVPVDLADVPECPDELP